MSVIFRNAFFIAGFFSVSICMGQSKPICQNKEYALYADRVEQKEFVGRALSSTELQSNYKSPANQFMSPAITFKFSINGKDNEMKSGIDHHFNFISSEKSAETPLIKFGTQLMDNRALPDNTYIPPKSQLKIRLDMRHVLDEVNKNGYYTTFNGDKIYKQDFKGVYVAGNTAPMTWDFDNLVNHAGLQLSDADGDGIYEALLTLNDKKENSGTSSSWKLSKDISAFPQYKSSYPLSDALYNLALEEMTKAVEPDSTFRTGKEWAGVWTRDVSYSIILSMAYLQPQVAKNSLLKKVNKRGRIIQDTGTGGAWPASTDRIVWAIAAWEIYKATGDEDWLKQAFNIIQNTLQDDYQVAYDKTTGLVKGESSFLDWREQTYPKWMQPADIYESECLGTNAVHYQANNILSRMAGLLGEKEASKKYEQKAISIKQAVNKYLWMPGKGYYAQFLYGRHSKIISPRSEALGEALAVLFGIAGKEKQAKIIGNTPVMPFGITCIYPQIPNMPPYHNNAVWPFVQSYWAMAAAQTGNEEAVLQSIAAIYRPAALWLTNKENFVASDGDFASTQINSSNMLWSLSGSIGLIHKIIFGIRFTEAGLAFQPFVPYALKGKRSLANFHFQNAVLDVELEGYGNAIKSFTLDGKAGRPFISKKLQGRHSIKIVLANNKVGGKVNNQDHYISLSAPSVRYSNNNLSWPLINGARQYKVLRDGKEIAFTDKTQMPITGINYGEYQVIALDEKGYESFASEPLFVAGKNLITTFEIENNTEKSSLNSQGFSGSGFVEISKTKNTVLTIPITIYEDGVYAIDFRYANGNGPANTENKCAIRSFKEGNEFLGTFIFPQRGKDEWSNWGWSNSVQTHFTKGEHILALCLESFNENMNGEINQAMLDYLRMIKIR